MAISATASTAPVNDDVTPTPLSIENLDRLSDIADVPQYNVEDVTSGVYHLGPSAFARAHIAVMADEILTKLSKEGKPLNWGITMGSLKSPTARDWLKDQDNLYSLIEAGQEYAKPKIIGSIREIQHIPDDVETALEAASHENIKVLSTTLTQKGYYFDETGNFDFKDADIVASLDENNSETCSIGFMVEVLRRRKDRGIPPPLMLSLDNMAGNGTIMRNAVLAYASKVSPELQEWIADEVKFPDNMVDRITPKTTDEHIQHVAQQGIAEAWPIITEPSVQLPLVIGNNSLDENNTPEFIKLLEEGNHAVVTPDVMAYELLKVRTLNGVHMALGCIGHAMGYQYTHEAMADPAIRKFSLAFMEQVGETLLDTPGMDQDTFRAEVLTRLDNPILCDQLTRLARNGTKKLPSRVLHTITDLMAKNEGPNGYQNLSFAVAAWVEYAKELDHEGRLPAEAEEKKQMLQQRWQDHLEEHAGTLSDTAKEVLSKIPYIDDIGNLSNDALERLKSLPLLGEIFGDASALTTGIKATFEKAMSLGSEHSETIKVINDFVSKGKHEENLPDPNDAYAATIGLPGLLSDDLVDPSPVFAIGEIFDVALAGNEELIRSVQRNLELIQEQGIEKALQTFMTAQGQSTSIANDRGSQDPRIDI